MQFRVHACLHACKNIFMHAACMKHACCMHAQFRRVITTAAKKRELASHLKKVKKTRRRAKLYSKKLNNRMVKSHKRRHKLETFKVKEHVLVRYRPQNGGNLPPKRRFVVKGTVVKKRKTNPDTYKVRFRPPNCSKHIEEWFSVEDIAGIRKRHPGSTNNDQQKIKQIR